MQPRRLLVTGGAGFIGSCFIRYGIKAIPQLECIVNLDLLTYAGDQKSLSEIENDECYTFVQGDICDQALIESLIEEHNIDTIVHFAAESHVDNSIENPHLFYETNIGGTIALLEAMRRHSHVHFHHVSTDEVFGSLGPEGTFTEESPYRPNSPYAASKAGSDHFVRAYAHTYGLSVTLSNCTNNYGPYQHKEKLIPLMISCCMEDKPLPIYGTGQNVRDWLFVEDHVRALWLLLRHGERGSDYAIGGGEELSNVQIVHQIIKVIAAQTDKEEEKLKKLISFVSDRPGHDFRYAIDSSKIHKELGWHPQHTFNQGLNKTVSWSLDHHQMSSCVSQS